MTRLQVQGLSFVLAVMTAYLNIMFCGGPMRFSLSSEDTNFQKQVEKCEFPVEKFDHRAHLRLAYIYLSKGGVHQANQSVYKTLHALLKHNQIDASSKYHETLTQAWLLAVNHFKQQASILCANALLEKSPQLLDALSSNKCNLITLQVSPLAAR